MKYVIAILALMLTATLASAKVIRIGNHAWAYDNQGRVTAHGVRNGNEIKLYDARGRLTFRGVLYGRQTLYDARGRVKISTYGAER